MKRFERYVLSEILPLLLGALAAVIVLLVLVALQDVIAPLLAKGAHPLLVARVLALNVPEATALALPIALMFATLLGLSRLSSDSEIKAALASGIPATRLYRPVLLLGLGVTLLTFAIGEGLVPRTKVMERQVKQQIVFDNPRVIGLGGRDESGQNVVLRDTLGRAISVGEVLPGGALRDLRIVTMQGGLSPREVITARRGQLRSGSNVLELQEGRRITYQSDRPVTILTFERGTLPVQDVQADLNVNGRPVRASALPLRDLLERTQSYRAQGVRAPSEFTALHRKLADPLAALALSFFAVTLALFSFRSGNDVGLVWALLLTFAYYATTSVFWTMGDKGALPGALAAYAPDLMAVLAGVVLLRLAARR